MSYRPFTLILLAAPLTHAADFTLPDTAGKPWALHDQKARAVVVAFLATECPMSNGYLPALNKVAKDYAEKGVVVVGVVPGDDSAAAVRKHAEEYKVPFPVLRDEAGRAVAAVGAKVTPEVFVLDAKHEVRYRGRIDDGYSARMKPNAVVTRHDLVAALDEVLAGKPVSVPETKAFGCPITIDPKAAKAADVTFHKDVEPILQAHCQSCHRPGQVGPFSLMTYKQAKKWMDTSLEEIEAKRMPPWKPAPNDHLADARSLPADAVKTLQAWVERGMPEGDPKDAPPPRQFTDGWTLGEPDLVLEPKEEMMIDGSGRDLFRVMVYPTNLPEDKYIAAMEVRPGNPRVVHHTLQLIDTKGRGRKLADDFQKTQKPTDPDRGPGYTVQMGWGFLPDRSGMLGGWAPGLLPRYLPDGVGQVLPAGADVLVQFHYHRTGKVETDKTKIGLYFAKKPVTDKFKTVPVTGLFLNIPAGDKAFRVENSWRLAEDVTVYRLTPHMHLLGKDITLTATVPGGKEQELIRIPAWDYNWQEQYELKKPLDLPKGTVLKVRATYDNSADNPHNPSRPPKPVRLGEQTTNEMCFVFVGVSSKSSSPRLLTPAWR
jgi:peroxiredoxin